MPPLWKRHNILRDALCDITTAAGIRCETEAKVRGKKRPADLLVYGA